MRYNKRKKKEGEEMALSARQRVANDKYIQKNYDRLPLNYPKTFCETVRSAASESGESLAGYVRKAIEYRMERDGTKDLQAKETEEAKP